MEKISGNRLREWVWDQIQSRRLGRMALLGTDQEWITVILDIRKQGPAHFLIIDGVPGFKGALASVPKGPVPKGQVFFEFLEADGVPCRFESRVFKCYPKEIWVNLPEELLRDQKRTFYRLEAPLDAELSFSVEAGKTVKAHVRDCSMGGLSFYLEGKMTIKVEQKLSHLLFQFPEANSPVSIHIAEAVVRRVEEKHWREKPFCALEIVEIADPMREKLGQLVFLNQRSLIRRVRRLPRGLRSI